jgi:hypothetical protein
MRSTCDTPADALRSFMKSLFGHVKDLKDVVGHVKEANKVYTTLSCTCLPGRPRTCAAP